MSSQSGRTRTHLGFDSLPDRFQAAVNCTWEHNKPDFRELDLPSPVSPLRTRTTAATSSSSSSSGSRPKFDLNGNSHSGELSVESSPSTARSGSGGSHPLIYSGSASVTSPALNVLPTGNICPSGRISKSGMATRSAKSDVLGSGSMNYGHGSIIRGGFPSKSGLESSPASNATGKRTGACGGSDPEELKRMGNDHYRKGNFAEALSFYDRAIAVSPATAVYYFNRSAALIGLRRLVEAVRECEEAIRLDPGYVRAHHRLGSLLLR